MRSRTALGARRWRSGCSGAVCRIANSPGASSAGRCPIGAYVVDFVCFAARLVIEVDGGQHAIDRRADVQRDRWFAPQGFRLLRFWNNEVLDNLDGVLQTIADTLAEQPPHPDPLPQGEREDPTIGRLPHLPQRERECHCDSIPLPSPSTGEVGGPRVGARGSPGEGGDPVVVLQHSV